MGGRRGAPPLRADGVPADRLGGGGSVATVFNTHMCQFSHLSGGLGPQPALGGPVQPSAGGGVVSLASSFDPCAARPALAAPGPCVRVCAWRRCLQRRPYRGPLPRRRLCPSLPPPFPRVPPAAAVGGAASQRRQSRGFRRSPSPLHGGRRRRAARRGAAAGPGAGPAAEPGGAAAVDAPGRPARHPPRAAVGRGAGERV